MLDLNLQYFVMTDNLCTCHCGTRITLDQQLLEERQIWKEKYNCLQKQATNDIGRLKENIYTECAALMQKEFTAKETEQNAIVNQKNAEIRSLTTRVINLESKVKILEKENEILISKSKELQAEVIEKETILQGIKSRGNKSQRDWEVRLQQEITALRKRITLQYQEELKKLEAQNQHLKHKVNEYDNNLKIIIPETEKLKNRIKAQEEQIAALTNKLDRLRNESEQQIKRAKQETEEVDAMHAKCKGIISKLSEKVDTVSHELEIARRVRKEVRVEPVYIDRPVQVQKIVQKLVEVEKVVTKYIEPTNFRDEELQQQNSKLKQEIANLLREIQLFEQKYRSTVQDYEQCIHQHEENVFKYKKEREALVKTIEEQNKEINTIHQFIERKKFERQSRSNQPQKIVVHVNKDGSYQKTVQRVSASNPVIVQNSGRGATKKR